MRLDNKNSISIYGSIIGLILLMCLGTFSYAYFTIDTRIDNSLNVIASVSNSFTPVFTGSSTGNLNLTITDADMLNGDAVTVVGSASQTLKATLIAGNTTTAASCTFDFVWTNTGTAYSPSSGLGSSKEYTIKILLNDSTTVFEEKQISSLTSGAVIASSSISSKGVSTTNNYKVTVTVYNLNIYQSIANKKYSSRVDIANVNCG